MTRQNLQEDMYKEKTEVSLNTDFAISMKRL